MDVDNESTLEDNENVTIDEYIENVFKEDETNLPIDEVMKEVLKKYAYDLKKICLDRLDENEKYYKVTRFIDVIKDIENENASYKRGLSISDIDRFLNDNEYLLNCCLPIIDEFLARYLIEKTDSKVESILENVKKMFSDAKILMDVEIKIMEEISEDETELINFKAQVGKHFNIIDIVSLIVMWCIVEDENVLISTIRLFIKDSENGIVDIVQYKDLIKKVEEKFYNDLYLNDMYEELYVQLCDLEIETQLKNK